MKLFKYFIFFFLLTRYVFANLDIYNEQLKINSNKIEVFKNSNKIIFFDNVILKHNLFTLFTDKMIVNYQTNNDSKININNILAIGNVVFKKDNIVAYGDRGVFNVLKNILILEDNIKVIKDDINLFSSKFEYNITDGSFNFDSNDTKRVKLVMDNDSMINFKIHCFEKLPINIQANIKERLKDNSLVIYNGSKIEFFKKNVIKKLISYIKKQNVVNNKTFAEKNICLVNAYLYAKLNPKCVWGQFITQEAVDILEKYNINYSVENIIDNTNEDSKCSSYNNEELKNIEDLDSIIYTIQTNYK